MGYITNTPPLPLKAKQERKMENRIQKKFIINGEDIYKIFLNGNRFPTTKNLSKPKYENGFEKTFVKCDEEISKEFRRRCTDIKFMNLENEPKFGIHKDKDERDEIKKEEKPNTDLDENKKQVIMKIQDEDSLNEYDSEIKKEKDKKDN